MGILDFIKGEFIEVIAWEDDTQDTMVWKFPVNDKQQIKEGAQLIVRESQVAVFQYNGQIADVYAPGKYTLNTDTMPVLTTLSNWKYLFNNHFKTDVYFINTKQFYGQKWGTPNPIMMRDADFGVVRLRSFGSFSFRVKDPVVFLKEAFGTSKLFKIDGILEHLKSQIVSGFSDALGESGIAAIDLASKYSELGQLISQKLQERFGLFGLEVADFVIENISLPPEVEAYLDKRSQMGILGNMDQYMKFQTAEAVRDAAKNEGGMAGMGAGLGAGAGIGQAMAASMMNMNTPQYAQPAPQAAPQPQQAAAPAMIACPHCHTQIAANSKFCPECGKSPNRTCPKCNTALSGNPKFCPECAFPLQQA